MVANALNWKAATAPIKDECLRMTVITPLLEQIQEAQVKAMKEEHQKSEHILR